MDRVHEWDPLLVACAQLRRDLLSHAEGVGHRRRRSGPQGPRGDRSTPWSSVRASWDDQVRGLRLCENEGRKQPSESVPAGASATLVPGFALPSIPAHGTRFAFTAPAAATQSVSGAEFRIFAPCAMSWWDASGRSVLHAVAVDGASQLDPRCAALAERVRSLRDTPRVLPGEAICIPVCPSSGQAEADKRGMGSQGTGWVPVAGPPPTEALAARERGKGWHLDGVVTTGGAAGPFDAEATRACVCQVERGGVRATLLVTERPDAAASALVPGARVVGAGLARVNLTGPGQGTRCALAASPSALRVVPPAADVASPPHLPPSPTSHTRLLSASLVLRRRVADGLWECSLWRGGADARGGDTPFLVWLPRYSADDPLQPQCGGTLLLRDAAPLVVDGRSLGLARVPSSWTRAEAVPPSGPAPVLPPTPPLPAPIAALAPSLQPLALDAAAIVRRKLGLTASSSSSSVGRQGGDSTLPERIAHLLLGAVSTPRPEHWPAQRAAQLADGSSTPCVPPRPGLSPAPWVALPFLGDAARALSRDAEPTRLRRLPRLIATGPLALRAMGRGQCLRAVALLGTPQHSGAPALPLNPGAGAALVGVVVFEGGTPVLVDSTGAVVVEGGNMAASEGRVIALVRGSVRPLGPAKQRGARGPRTAEALAVTLPQGRTCGAVLDLGPAPLPVSGPLRSRAGRAVAALRREVEEGANEHDDGEQEAPPATRIADVALAARERAATRGKAPGNSPTRCRIVGRVTSLRWLGVEWRCASCRETMRGGQLDCAHSLLQREQPHTVRERDPWRHPPVVGMGSAGGFEEEEDEESDEEDEDDEQRGSSPLFRFPRAPDAVPPRVELALRARWAELLASGATPQLKVGLGLTDGSGRCQVRVTGSAPLQLLLPAVSPWEGAVLLLAAASEPVKKEAGDALNTPATHVHAIDAASGAVEAWERRPGSRARASDSGPPHKRARRGDSGSGGGDLELVGAVAAEVKRCARALTRCVTLCEEALAEVAAEGTAAWQAPRQPTRKRSVWGHLVTKVDRGRTILNADAASVRVLDPRRPLHPREVEEADRVVEQFVQGRARNGT